MKVSINNKNGDSWEITGEQLVSLWVKYRVSPNNAVSFDEFVKTVVPEMASHGTIMVFWCGMWLGIEQDGHTHTVKGR